MKDEIKEILDKLKSNNYPFGIATIDINKLEDYITNLQEENRILKENAEHNDKVVDKAKWNEMIYKSRNEKAIEYIKQQDMKYYGAVVENKMKIILNILQGEDKDE